MAITAISIDEAFAQGSSSSQMYSVAKFHRDEAARTQRSAVDALARMPDWKAKRYRQFSDAAVRSHGEYAEHFEALSRQMKVIEEARISGDGA